VFITILFELTEVQPAKFVTVNVYVPAGTPVMTATVPLPEIVTSPGFRVNIQDSEGNPLNATLPVSTMHVGWVMFPGSGADGVRGCGLIKTAADTNEVHPSKFFTVKL
jgi:hypothetical protein